MNGETLEQEFQKLMQNDPTGTLQPEAIVEAAKNPSSPLHSYFDWDQDEAAEKWRQQQAKELIWSYKIDVPELNIKVRALTSLQTGKGSGFLWTKDVIADPDMRRRMLDLALRDLLKLENKYSHLEELAQLWDVTHTIKNEISQ